MAYITDLMKGTIEPRPNHITLEQYVHESSYITQYLSRLVKDNALSVYRVLFHLSWFENGKGEITVPWSRVGSFIVSEQGNIIDDGVTVRRRLPSLIEKKCITVNRQRSGANIISIHLPSDIPICRTLIEQEERETLNQIDLKDERDYYNDSQRRLAILDRDNHTCVYCTAPLSEDNFVLDHLIPVSKGGTNRKHNLAAACEVCNRRRSDSAPIVFLRENYRQQLITQDEFLQLKIYIESLLAE
jgi:5-methylcytosine-specific restriction endonuclease McrA